MASNSSTTRRRTKGGLKLYLPAHLQMSPTVKEGGRRSRLVRTPTPFPGREEVEKASKRRKVVKEDTIIAQDSQAPEVGRSGYGGASEASVGRPVHDSATTTSNRAALKRERTWENLPGLPATYDHAFTVPGPVPSQDSFAPQDNESATRRRQTHSCKRCISVKQEPEEPETVIKQEESTDFLDKLRSDFLPSDGIPDPLIDGSLDIPMEYSGEPAAAARIFGNEQQNGAGMGRGMYEPLAVECLANTEHRDNIPPAEFHSMGPPPAYDFVPAPYAPQIQPVATSEQYSACSWIRPIVDFGNLVYTGPPTFVCDSASCTGAPMEVRVFPDPIGPAEEERLKSTGGLPIRRFLGLTSLTTMTVVQEVSRFPPRQFRGPSFPAEVNLVVDAVDHRGRERGWEGGFIHPADVYGESGASVHAASG